MKKLLLVTTALVGVAMMSAPANAAVKLGLGGYFSTYGTFADSDEVAGAAASLREFDWRRDSEVFFTGATTLDNGLTVGINYELDLGNAASFLTDEAYMYFSGGWGRVNIGSEDGSAFLLQVTAPSADANVDGMQTTMQAIAASDPVFSNLTGAQATTGVPGLQNSGTLDYEHISGTALNNLDRLTYLTPKFNGFQAGVSFAPQNVQGGGATSITPMALDETAGAYENIWEGAARWDGEFSGFGIAVGGGYSHASLQAQAAAPGVDAAPIVSDDLTTWNAGMNLAWSGFSLGGAYLRSDTANDDALDPAGAPPLVVNSLDVEETTWVVGLGYDNGPWHLGASYLDKETERDANGVLADDGELAAIDAEVHKYTVGGGYTFGPGMTFNGAIAWGEYDNNTGASDLVAGAQAGGLAGAAATNNSFQQVTVGTNIQF